MSIEEIEHKSFLFIDHNFDATFADVPEDFLKLWRILDPIDTYLRSDYQNRYEFRIFRYALNKYQHQHNLLFPEEIILALFRIFQIMLATPVVYRLQFPRATAFKIFDFQLYLELI